MSSFSKEVLNPKTGEIELAMFYDDSVISIDGELVMDFGGLHGTVVETDRGFKRAHHNYAVVFRNGVMYNEDEYDELVAHYKEENKYGI